MHININIGYIVENDVKMSCCLLVLPKLSDAELELLTEAAVQQLETGTALQNLLNITSKH